MSTLSPSSKTSPAFGRKNPKTALSAIDFPTPFAPRIAEIYWGREVAMKA
ncbi:uncharacterized protein METZ01_LOCUS288389, partial [marine metagenome]